VGTQYSASLDYADSKGPIKWGDHVFQGETNKYLVSFRVTGGNVRFSIRTLTSVNGDTNYELDQYNLNLSQDGRQLTGTVMSRIDEEGTAPMRMTRADITLFPTDWNTRSQP
jgi:hypothetical protein